MKPVNTWVIGDLHLGHERIPEFRPEFPTWRDMADHIVRRWRFTVQPNDKIWLLGDAAFTLAGFDYLRGLPGRKYLVRGNHDELPIRTYLEVFEEIYGIVKFRKNGYHPAWLTHAPIHPHELRGCINIHGHVHTQTVMQRAPGIGLERHNQPDPRYVNVCPEAVGYAPVLLRELLIKKEKDNA